MKKQGLLVIISSPSGGGKDSVITALLRKITNSTRLITTTSKERRPDNIDGVNYYFITEDEFKDKIRNNEFIEYNIYSNNYYGTQKKHLQETLDNNDVVFTQLEVNGKHNLDKLKVPHLSIFLLPDNLDILRKRIEKRGGLTTKQINDRIEIAKQEIANSYDYDYKITNEEGKLDNTINTITEVVQNELKKT